MTEARQPTGSLADRISAPSATNTKPTIGSWADEVASPAEKNEKMGSLAGAQTDGATEVLGGSQLLPPSEYEVEVKLSDIQGDESSPLYSVNTFEELGM